MFEDEEGPSVATRLRLVWQWARRQIYTEICDAGFHDVNRAHISVFRYPGLEGRRPTEIAEDMQITKQSVNELIGHLERHGYLQRTVDPTDGRSRIIQLTPRGAASSARRSPLLVAPNRNWRTCSVRSDLPTFGTTWTSLFD